MSDWVHSADTIDLETRMGRVRPTPDGPITGSILTAPSSTGVTVSETSALAVSAVFAAVRVISEAIGTLPLNVYRKDGQKRFLAPDHPAYRVLHSQANPEAPASVARVALVAKMLLHGNSYAEIERDPLTGEVVNLWPLSFANVTPWRDNDGFLFYRCTPYQGNIVDFAPEDILHFRGFSLDGLIGVSVIRQARESLGLNISLERYGAGFFGRGARPGVLLKHPGRLSDDARKRLREGWEQIHQGGENSHRTAILEEGMEVSTVSVPNDDAQFLESRKFGVEEIARWFGLPLSRLRVQGATAFSNIEQDGIDFVVNTLRPHLVRMEQEISIKLFPHGDYYAEHSVEGLLRGDIQTRYNTYAIGRNNGWLSVNDVRQMEGQPPIEGGDTYMQPLNMQTISQQTSGTQTPPATPQFGQTPLTGTSKPLLPARDPNPTSEA